MESFDLHFPEINYKFPMVYVQGTNGTPYLFGADEKLEINTGNFFISKFPVTQALWEHIMGTNPAFFQGKDRPVECVSYDDIMRHNGFLEMLNGKTSHEHKLRLPTETEWEYAARGGVHWKDDLLFSGSNDISEVDWQDSNRDHHTQTHPVGEKKPNQLGIYDMCGNVWEWCEDYFQRDVNNIPKDGSACLMGSDARVLRGGCHHNWAVHCTVSKRYEIAPDAKDECIGFRIALTA